MKSFNSLLLVSTAFTTFATALYELTDDFTGDAFFESFDFFNGQDPTNGAVSFQPMSAANKTQLAGFLDDPQSNYTKSIYLGVDSSTVGTDRASVRVASKKTWQHALVIADIAHMPGGICGVWPAFWMLGEGTWPAGGEIDIVEGVHDMESNQMTLHTNAGSSLQNSTAQSSSTSGSKTGAGSQQVAGADSISYSGKLLTSNCDVKAQDQSQNAGCSIADTSNLTFGKSFNANGGGVYATQWTSDFIKIWFFARGQIPDDIVQSKPDPTNNAAAWGIPLSTFSGSDINIDEHFKQLNIIFDTTFCGDWAGRTWNDFPTCAALAPTCEQYVGQNPHAFTDAFWAVNTVQVYQDSGDSTGTVTNTLSVNLGSKAQALPAPRNTGRFITGSTLAKISQLVSGGSKRRVNVARADVSYWLPRGRKHKVEREYSSATLFSSDKKDPRSIS